MSKAAPIPKKPDAATLRKSLKNYRWVLVLLGLGILVSALLVFAENRVYEPATPFVGGTGDHVHAFALDPFHANHFYVGSHYGFFRTDDGGATWDRLNNASGMKQTLVATSISVSPIESNVAYVAGYLFDTGNAAGIFVTSDDGKHWQSLPTGGTGQLPDPRLLFVTAGWAHSGEAYAYSVDTGLYQTLDGGTHWRVVAPTFAGQVTTFIPVLDCGNATPQITGTACPERFMVGTTQGLFTGMTNADGTITFTASPLVPGYIYAVSPHRGTNPAVYVSAQSGVYRADSPGANFAQITDTSSGGATYTSLVVGGTNDQTLLGVTAQNAIQRSRDGGHTWDVGGSASLARGLSQLQSGLRNATGSNTPQWAGGQNVFLTLLQAPIGDANAYAAVSFPVQLFRTSTGGDQWSDLSK